MLACVCGLLFSREQLITSLEAEAAVRLCCARISNVAATAADA